MSNTDKGAVGFIPARELAILTDLFQEWCKILGIESTMSTAYHPQTDGQTEHVNWALEQYLRCYANYNLSNWSDLLPSAEFAYNNQAHEESKKVCSILNMADT